MTTPLLGKDVFFYEKLDDGSLSTEAKTARVIGDADGAEGTTTGSVTLAVFDQDADGLLSAKSAMVRSSNPTADGVDGVYDETITHP